MCRWIVHQKKAFCRQIVFFKVFLSSRSKSLMQSYQKQAPCDSTLHICPSLVNIVLLENTRILYSRIGTQLMVNLSFIHVWQSIACSPFGKIITPFATLAALMTYFCFRIVKIVDLDLFYATAFISNKIWFNTFISPTLPLFTCLKAMVKHKTNVKTQDILVQTIQKQQMENNWHVLICSCL